MDHIMTIEDAINLHKCIESIKEDLTDDLVLSYSVVIREDIRIEYELVGFGDVKILSVSFGQLKSEKSKNLIQEYFDNLWQE